MARPLRIIQTESPYHLMCRTNNREFRFVRKIITRIFFQVLAKSAEKYNVRVHHVVLMSNHYHLIVSATERNIHRFMQYLNARVAVRYNKATGHSGHVWGDRYKACIIQSDEHYRHVVRYIYRNPLRAGMVRDLAAFENSSFPFYAYGRKIDVPLAPDHLVRDLDGDRSKVAWYFKNLVLDEESPFPSDHLIKASLRRRCYGAEGFLQRLLAALPH